jgi:hypothetical protein
MKPGPEWCGSNAFLRELLADRSDEEKGQALVVMVGRWRHQKTFMELAVEAGRSVADARKALSVLRMEGDAVWARKQRVAAKAAKNAQLTARAKELFARELTVREVAEIVGVSVGLASELRRAA